MFFEEFIFLTPDFILDTLIVMKPKLAYQSYKRSKISKILSHLVKRYFFKICEFIV